MMLFTSIVRVRKDNWPTAVRGAYEDALYRGIKGRSWRVRYQHAGLSCCYAASYGVYRAQSHMRLIGDPDRERKLAQRLEFGNLALAGFTRSSLGRSSWAYIHSIISLLFCNQYLVG